MSKQVKITVTIDMDRVSPIMQLAKNDAKLMESLSVVVGSDILILAGAPHHLNAINDAGRSVFCGAIKYGFPEPRGDLT